MTSSIILFIVGLILLIKGGDWFVDGSSNLAKRIGISDLIIGATIVSIGTTLPEVMVSTTSAFYGHGEIAFGNAIGSIICNTALIAAISIIIKPSKIDKKSLTGPLFFFLIAALVFVFSAYLLRDFPRFIGIILILIFILYAIYIIKTQNKEISVEKEEANESSTLIVDIGLLVVGAIAIAYGSNLLIDNGIIIAEFIGVPEKVIAITFIALGTSLPELVTAISALIKGHGLLSIGNIIGANLFNLVLVCGISISLSPFALPSASELFGINSTLSLDIPVMLLVMGILSVPPLFNGKLSRVSGIILLIIYISFCIIQYGV